MYLPPKEIHDTTAIKQYENKIYVRIYWSEYITKTVTEEHLSQVWIVHMGSWEWKRHCKQSHFPETF